MDGHAQKQAFLNVLRITHGVSTRLRNVLSNLDVSSWADIDALCESHVQCAANAGAGTLHEFRRLRTRDVVVAPWPKQASISQGQLGQILQRVADGESQASVALDMPITAAQVSSICRGNTFYVHALHHFPDLAIKVWKMHGRSIPVAEEYRRDTSAERRCCDVCAAEGSR